MNFDRLISGLNRRGREASVLASLSIRRWLSGNPIWVDVGGVKLPFHGDGDRQELYYHLHGKEWWSKELGLISPYVKQGNVVVDVGANLGFMSGIFSTLTGATGHVYSFEPSPSTYAKLVEMIKVNNYSNVTANNMGCGKEEQSMTLYCPPSSGNASLRPDPHTELSSRNHKTVRIIKLDDFLAPKLERFDFLKIDTEGFEDEVLFGAAEILQRFKPVVYIELSAQYLASSENAIRFLRDHGYTFDREPNLREGGTGENYFALPPDFKS